MVTLERLSDVNLDELYLTLRHAIRTDYADKPILRNHAQKVLSCVVDEKTKRVLA